jgi:hypothetical protein
MNAILIMSKEGSQQFCITVHPQLMSLASKLKVGYIDDLTLGGPEAQVARDD